MRMKIRGYEISGMTIWCSVELRTRCRRQRRVNESVRSGLCGCGGLLCCFSVSAMAQWCGSTLVTDDSRLFTLSVDLRL